MKKFRAISLIETLISLTIVSVSVVALLPVMTLKKDTNDPTHGNTHWVETGASHVYTSGTKNEEYDVYSPKNNYKIAIGKHEVPDRAFSVDGSGLLDLNFYSLNTGEFFWNKMKIDNNPNLSGATDPAGSAVHLASDYNTTTRADGGTFSAFNRNLYVDANRVVIENGISADDPTNSFAQSPDKSGIRNSNRYFTISNAGVEYLTYDSTNDVVGIGYNAAKYYPAGNFIGIMHNEVIEPSSGVTPAPFAYPALVMGNPFRGTTSYGKEAFPLVSLKEGATVNTYINGKFMIKNYTAKKLFITSDKRLKTILGDYTKGLSEIRKIKPVEYTFKSDKEQKHHIGVIAQDLQKVFPEAVAKNPKTGYLMVATSPVFYAFINSVKELHNQNIELKKENDKLEEKIATLRDLRDKIKASQGGKNE